MPALRDLLLVKVIRFGTERFSVPLLDGDERLTSCPRNHAQVSGLRFCPWEEIDVSMEVSEDAARLGWDFCCVEFMVVGEVELATTAEASWADLEAAVVIDPFCFGEEVKFVFELVEVFLLVLSVEVILFVVMSNRRLGL